MKEMVGGCCVCSDDRGWPENPLVYCDGQFCTVAVHQACYGIVTVPTGPWYCRKCESQERSVKVKCELCPSKYGALKRTDNSGWAHVVCALYIPEVRFGNVTTMEPIQLQLIPAERFNKVCYICEENGKAANGAVGACMQCNKAGCKQQFHVTCAQSLGLLCEEAGNYFDNVKYCGYCQHHYSKLKKGGHVKTIPPYKPVSGENQQSDSDKEGESSKSSIASQGKRKSAASKTAAAKTTAVTKPSTSYQKQSPSNKSGDKVTKTNSSVKSAKSVEESAPVESDKTEKKEPETDKEVRDNIKSKKRKANSRTPTPSIISEANTSVPTESATTINIVVKKETPVQNTENSDKVKKVKTDLPAPLSLSKAVPTSTTSVTTTISTPVTETPVITQVTAPSIIQNNQPQLSSVVVSVPLQNTSLSPNNKQEIVPTPIIRPAKEEESNSQIGVLNLDLIENTPMITSEMSSGGLKIAYESQPNATKMELDEEVPPMSTSDVPVKRARSQSTEKIEKATRSKKKNANGVLQNVNMAPAKPKRSGRSQHNTPPPQLSNPFVNMSQGNQVKDSPPSSPSSESLGAPPTLGRKKGRKSAPATISDASSSSQNKDTKENIKLIPNGISAPHMLGNQLNLNSNMAQKMTDHLNSELEAHSVFNSGESSSNLVGPQLHHRVIASARSSSAGGSSTASAGSGLSSMLGGNGAAIPQTLDQLLERQWEQGSQFLMEQAQHFDIASLLSCLHQLRAENLRLEEHVSSLLQRRDHLLAVNARLAIPLTGTPAAPQSSHPHTVNNIHPAVAANHADPHRPRHSNPYPHMQGAGHPANPIENGLSPEGYPNSHRSPATSQPQPSPNLSGYTNNGVVRQQSESSGRSAPRPHSYGMYQTSSSNQTQQGVVRRDGDPHHPGSSKLS